MSDDEPLWYKVEFHGQPAKGATPLVGRSWDDLLVVAGKLCDAFGFERIDDIKLLPCEQDTET